MTGFLARLAARQIAPGGGLRPRAVSRFAGPEAGVVPDASAPRVALDMRATAPAPAAQAASAPPAHAVRPALAAPTRVDTGPLPRPDHEPPARRPTPRDGGRPTSPADMLRADESTVPDATRAEAVLQAPPSPPQEPPPYVEPLVPREIARARTAREPEAQGPVRVAAASRPPAVPPAEETVVRITIGRIEVRAATPTPAPPREKRAAPRPGTMSLDEYLDRRHGKRR